ncbi:hypothetical protein [Hyphococcus sp.]|jgi:hypothetical protein|uniref:hypothetical protein n=1 Tax=Hyphococcus sp. TaxID=2038636 RepID=UPI003D12FAB5
MFWIILIVLVVGGAVFAAASMKGKQQAFVDMGDVTGKTINEIIAKVGPPSSVSAVGAGEELYQWIETNSAGGYHYALLFKDGKCEGYTHQHAQ